MADLPAVVVGDSHTGEMDKVDGPYYFLPLIARLAALPGRLPLVVPDLGATNRSRSTMSSPRWTS